MNAWQVPTLYEGVLPAYVFDKAKGENVICPADRALEPRENFHVAWVRFDLRRPLESQLDSIKRWAVSYRNFHVEHGAKELPSGKPRSSKFRDYLRVLDAKMSGVTNNEIARQIFKNVSNRYPDYLGNKTVDNAYRTAKRLSMERWQTLLDEYREVAPKSPRRKSRVP